MYKKRINARIQVEERDFNLGNDLNILFWCFFLLSYMRCVFAIKRKGKVIRNKFAIQPHSSLVLLRLSSDFQQGRPPQTLLCYAKQTKESFTPSLMNISYDICLDDKHGGSSIRSHFTLTITPFFCVHFPQFLEVMARTQNLRA